MIIHKISLTLFALQTFVLMFFDISCLSFTFLNIILANLSEHKVFRLKRKESN